MHREEDTGRKIMRRRNRVQGSDCGVAVTRLEEHITVKSTADHINHINGHSLAVKSTRDNEVDKERWRE